MDFNSQDFLFLFLPIFLCLFLLVNSSYRKWLILLASASFYFFYQKENFLLILGICFVNYMIVFSHGRCEQKPGLKRFIFWSGVIANIGLLIYFRIISTQSSFVTDLLAGGELSTLLPKHSFPLGLSFITFSVISALIDAHKSQESQPKNFLVYLQYLLFFPKVVVGPIMKFRAFESQLNQLPFSWARFAEGSKRFITGLAKKVIIADQLAVIVNAGFGLDKPAFPTSIAWIILIAFYIQIYYDFSGYVDMGIGIAHMIGFDLPENFNLPYLSKNLSDFWRRWHMTLAGWFREYVFYPLEFERRKSRYRWIKINVVVVFLLTGLWHGLTLNYLVWGLVQGVVIAYENSRWGAWIKRLPEFGQHFYFLGIVLFSWVIFRSPTIGFALRFFKRLIVFDQNVQMLPYSVSQPLPIINNTIILIMVIGILGLIPFSKMIENSWIMRNKVSTPGKLVMNVGMIILLLLSIALSVSQNFVPSIYGKF